MRAIALVMLVGCGSTATSPPEPTGPHMAYAIDHVYLPTNNIEARAYGLDLNSDGTIDNQLGMVLGTIGSMGVDSQKATAEALGSGAISLVADLQTPSFADTHTAGFTIMFGDLQADSSYAVASDSPMDEPLVGHALNGDFELGPGDLSIRFAFVDPSIVITLPLQFARVEIAQVDDNGIMSAIVAGAVSQEALDTGFLPAARQGLQSIVTRDCHRQTTADCGCQQGSLGASLLNEFDVSPADCTISLPELTNASLTKSLLALDLAFGGKKYLSAGFAITGVATRLD